MLQRIASVYGEYPSWPETLDPPPNVILLPSSVEREEDLKDDLKKRSSQPSPSHPQYSPSQQIRHLFQKQSKIVNYEEKNLVQFPLCSCKITCTGKERATKRCFHCIKYVVL